jgi:hypothetical protein
MDPWGSGYPWVAVTMAMWRSLLCVVLDVAKNLLARDLLCACSMKVRHAIAILLALVVAPLLLGLGVFLLIPVALVLLPVLAIAGIAVLPAALSAMSRSSEPTVAAESVHAPATA